MSQQVRLAITVLIIAAAILMIVVVPLLTNSMINPIVQGQLTRIEKLKASGTPENVMQAALMSPGPWVIAALYPVWAVLSLVAGFALLVVARLFYRGEAWTRGFALLCFSIPSIGGGFMLVPWINFVGTTQGGFPSAIVIMAIGLIPYFAILLADKGDAIQKVVEVSVFFMLGVTAAESFSNSVAAFRTLYGHPKRPLIPDDLAVTWLATDTLFIGAALLIAAIYLLGNRRRSGWYVALIGALSTFVASGVTHYFRHATNDYLYGALMGLTVAALLVIPQMKARLIESAR